MSPFAPISADGRYVVFSTENSFLPTDGTGNDDVYRYDRQTGEAVLVSFNQNDTGSGNYGSLLGTISADDRGMVFENGTIDLVSNHGNAVQDVFARDLAIGATTLVSLNHAVTGSGNVDSFDLKVNVNGSIVAFGNAPPVSNR